jgi:hypothetical protein
VATRGCFPGRLCGAVHDCLVVGGALGGDATWLFKRASKEVALSASLRALLVAPGQRAWVALVRLAMNLDFVVPSLPLPQWGLG